MCEVVSSFSRTASNVIAFCIASPTMLQNPSSASSSCSVKWLGAFSLLSSCTTPMIFGRPSASVSRRSMIGTHSVLRIT